jgi:predicted transcriptional regulator
MPTTPPSPDVLSPLESSVMAIVWRLGEATAEDVGRELPDPLTNASVRTLLRRIEAKQFLTHRVDKRTFIYRPRVEEDAAARGALQRLADRFYGGSFEALVLGMVNGRMIHRRDLDRLSRRVARATAAKGEK